MKQTTIRLDERDQAAIAAIRDYYGVSSDIDAIRIALRETERHIRHETTPPYPPAKDSPFLLMSKDEGTPGSGC